MFIKTEKILAGKIFKHFLSKKSTKRSIHRKSGDLSKVSQKKSSIASSTEYHHRMNSDQNVFSTPRTLNSIIRNPSSLSEGEHHTRLGEHAAALWMHNQITDVVVKLRGISYPAHKTVLSCYSKYFKDMLLEANGKLSVINLQVESVTNEAFSVLLKYMYTADLELTCQNIGEVYTAARKLGMDGALQICIKILKGKNRIEVHSVYVYATAKKLGLLDSAERALETMCKRFEQIVGTPEFLELTYDQVMEYLSANTLATRSEVIVYLAALKWVSVKFLEREQFATDVISCVRFPLMTLNEILACHSPPLLPGIVEFPAIKTLLLQATCFVAAKTVNEEKRFQRYSCTERNYLLPKEPIILWDPNIFDSDRHAMYTAEMAATTIQAAFRGYRTRKSIHEKDDAATVVQRAYRMKRTPSIDLPPTDDKSLDEEYKEHYSDIYKERKDKIKDKDKFARKSLLSDKIKTSVNKFFRRPTTSSSRSDSEDSLKEEEMKKSEPSWLVDVHKPTYLIRKKEIKEPAHRGINRKGADRITRAKSDMDIKKTTESVERKDESESAVYKIELSEEEASPEATSSVEALSRHVSRIVGDTNKSEDEEILPEQVTRLDKIHKIRVCALNDSQTLDSKLAVDETAYDSSAKTESIEEIQEKSRPISPKIFYEGIFLTGGFNADKIDTSSTGKSVYLYEPNENKWTSLNDMPTQLHHHKLIYIDGWVYSIGGCNPDQTKEGKMMPLRNCYKFDLTTMIWRKISKMKHSRMYHAVVALNGKIYVIGGKDDDDRILKSIEVFDVQSATWEYMREPLHQRRMGVGACCHSDMIWILGGMIQDNHGNLSISSDVNRFNPSNQEWCKITVRLPRPLAFSTVIEFNNHLYVLGGTTYSDDESVQSDQLMSVAEVMLYDESRNQWKEACPLPEPRHYVAAGIVGKSLFVVGGLTSYRRASLLDVLNLIDDEWHHCANIPESLCGYDAVSIPELNDKNVYLKNRKKLV